MLNKLKVCTICLWIQMRICWVKLSWLGEILPCRASLISLNLKFKTSFLKISSARLDFNIDKREFTLICF